MTLSDDTPVGSGNVSVPHGWDGKKMPVLVRLGDLDKHIQDRLRAAEELAEGVALLHEWYDMVERGLRPDKTGLFAERVSHYLAAYEATFPKEASK